MNECHPLQGLSEARRVREFPETFPSKSAGKRASFNVCGILCKERGNGFAEILEIFFLTLFLGLRHVMSPPPPLWHPPGAITPEKVIRDTIAKRRGGSGGQALSPPKQVVYPLLETQGFYKAEKIPSINRSLPDSRKSGKTGISAQTATPCLAFLRFQDTISYHG